MEKYAYLIAEDSDGAGWGNLLGTEPDGGDIGRDPEDEDVGDGSHRLPDECHIETIRNAGEQFHPNWDTGQRRSDYHRVTESLK